MTPAAPAESEGLIGRGAEIDVLQSFIERATLRGEALVLVGDAGVGKTALLDDKVRSRPRRPDPLEPRDPARPMTPAPTDTSA